MKPRRRGMVITGWIITCIGISVVLFWTVLEALSTFGNAPLQTVIGVLLVLALLVLMVPVPLIAATRRARAQRVR